MMKWPLFLLSSYIFAGPVERGPIETKKIHFSNQRLKEFVSSSYDYKVTFSPGEVSYGKRNYFSYKTKIINDLEDYAVVQFMRGCHFISYEDRGQIKKYVGMSHYHFGKVVPLKHNSWVVDTRDMDPIYLSSDEYGTHGLYLQNSKRDSYQQKSESYYYEKTPRYPRLYASVMPSTAFISNGEAINLSMELKTCLFKTKDVTANSYEQLIDKAIACYDWNNFMTYDYKKKKFVKKQDEFCFKN
jgi:hypothetical protein